VVGGIADQLLAGTPAGKKVRQILGSTLQSAAGWADCARSVESSQGQWNYTRPGRFKDCALYENPASEAALVAFVQRNASRCGGFAKSSECRHKAYHFTDQSIDHATYDPSLPGNGPQDLVHALGAALVVLQGKPSPTPFNIRGQREALRLLIHYVGDEHQPLHVGSRYVDDAGRAVDPATPQQAHAQDNSGGNAIVIAGTDLHHLWDDIPSSMKARLLGGAGAAQARQLPPSPGQPADWPALWASDTLVQAAQAWAALSVGARQHSAEGDSWPASAAEPGYRLAREQLQQKQLVKAGARLAQMLKSLWP
jgi:hypothetical protein